MLVLEHFSRVMGCESAGQPRGRARASSWRRRVLARFAGIHALVAAAACSGGQASEQDGLGDMRGPDAGASTSDATIESTAVAEGCACGTPGATATCPGAKIHVGTRTICPPGVRVCAGGIWGACLPTDVGAAGISSVTQDYESTCAGATHVRWGSLVLQGQAPGNSQVGVGVQVANTQAELNAEAYQLVAAFDANVPWSPIDVEASLGAAGVEPGSFLRVTVLRMPSANGTMPTVTWNQAWDCVTP